MSTYSIMVDKVPTSVLLVGLLVLGSLGAMGYSLYSCRNEMAGLPACSKTFGGAALILLLLLSWLAYTCFSAGFTTQRVWPRPNIKPPTEHMTFTADSVLPPNKVFLTKMQGKVPSVFKTDAERAKVKQEATKFFKQQFGVSDSFLNGFMSELTVNDKMGYKAVHVKSSPGKSYTVVDGGFSAFVPPSMTLYGRYGGKNGVSSKKSGILTLGYYFLEDDKGNRVYTLKYYGNCPLTTLSTFDGDYTFVDCEVDVVESPNKATVGKSGKAQGVGIYKKLNGDSHVVIRNVVTI